MNRKYSFIPAIIFTVGFLCACSSSKARDEAAYDAAANNMEIAETAVNEETGDVIISYNVEASRALAVHNQVTPTGDMTIREGTPLNTGYSAEIGPLVGGKLPTYQRVGAVIYNFYFEEEYSEGTRLKSTNLKLSLLDCNENSSSPLVKIRPLEDPMMLPSLDGEHIFVIYTPLPEEVPPPNNINELNELLTALPLHILRINVNDLSMTEYELNLSSEQLTGAYPVGSNYLLLQSSTDTLSESGIKNTISESLTLLDLSSGKLRNFSRMDYIYKEDGTYASPSVIISPVSASEDKIYFKTITQVGNDKKLGFRVYDSSMNFIDGIDLMLVPSTDSDIYMEMCVSNQEIFCRVASIDGKMDNYYYYAPFTSGYYECYNLNQFLDFKGTTFYTANPRNSTDFDYAMLQTVDSDGDSYLSLSSPSRNSYYQVKIDIPGFQRPDFYLGSHEVITDYDGGVILRSYGSDHYNSEGIITPFNYYYISKEEMYRAIYGDNNLQNVQEAPTASKETDAAVTYALTAVIPE